MNASRKDSTPRSEWIDPDDAPELGDDFFAKADRMVGRKVVRRGRPRLARPKEVVTMRLDADLVEKLRASGKGWQTRVNDMLRKDVGL